MASFGDLYGGQWDSLKLQYVDLSGPDRDRPGDRKSGIGRRYANIVEALSLCEHLSATDPRDRVYAILSLVDGDLVTKFNVDYGKAIVAVFSDVARFSLRKYSSLGFLLRAFKCNRVYDCPSWVPDWSCTSTGAPPVVASQLVMHCADGQGSRYPPRVSEDERDLIVFGTRLDKLTAVHKYMTWQRDGEGAPSHVQIWVSQLKSPNSVLLQDDSSTISFDDVLESRWKAFLRTMMRAEIPQERADAEEYLEVFKIILPAALEIDQTEGQSLAEAMPEKIRGLWLLLTQMMGMATLGNYFSITEAGTFGLMPEGAQTGDEIWALLHCPKAILLRPKSEYYEVVGPCHIDDECLFEDLKMGLPNEQKYPIREIILK